MTWKNELTEEELASVKTSFINILTLFLGDEKVESRYVGCLLKWAIQLQFDNEDLKAIEQNFQHLAFSMPTTKEEKLDSIIDLVQMIYLDKIVEDIELEVATVYAQQMGFEKHLVTEVFQSLETASIEGKDIKSVRNEVKNLINNSY